MLFAVNEAPTAAKSDGDGRDADEGRKDQIPPSSLNVETQAPQVSTNIMKIFKKYKVVSLLTLMAA